MKIIALKRFRGTVTENDKDGEVKRGAKLDVPTPRANELIRAGWAAEDTSTTPAKDAKETK